MFLRDFFNIYLIKDNVNSKKDILVKISSSKFLFQKINNNQK